MLGAVINSRNAKSLIFNNCRYTVRLLSSPSVGFLVIIQARKRQELG